MFIDQGGENESDEEEDFRDVDENDPHSQPTTNGRRSPKPRSLPAYDGKKRDPEFSNAENSCLWELVSQLLLFNQPRP